MKKVLNIVAVFLILMSLFGEFIILDFRVDFPTKPRSYEKTLKSIDSLHSKYGDSERFFTHAGVFYSKGINYSWGGNDTEIPFWKNYLLYFFSKAEKGLAKIGIIDSKSTRFSKYESSDYKISLGRGFGICSQNSLGFSDLLNDRYGIKTKVVGLDGHVVVYNKTEHIEQFIDPSLGISFKTDHDTIDNQLAAIQSMYDKTAFPELGKTFNKKGNVIPEEYGAKGYKPRLVLFENIFNILKYLLPLVLLLILNRKYVKRYIK